jgi:hypothetical protein
VRGVDGRTVIEYSAAAATGVNDGAESSAEFGAILGRKLIAGEGVARGGEAVAGFQLLESAHCEEAQQRGARFGGVLAREKSLNFALSSVAFGQALSVHCFTTASTRLVSLNVCLRFPCNRAAFILSCQLLLPHRDGTRPYGADSQNRHCEGNRVRPQTAAALRLPLSLHQLIKAHSKQTSDQLERAIFPSVFPFTKIGRDRLIGFKLRRNLPVAS